MTKRYEADSCRGKEFRPRGHPGSQGSRDESGSIGGISVVSGAGRSPRRRPVTRRSPAQRRAPPVAVQPARPAHELVVRRGRGDHGEGHPVPPPLRGDEDLVDDRLVTPPPQGSHLVVVAHGEVEEGPVRDHRARRDAGVGVADEGHRRPRRGELGHRDEPHRWGVGQGPRVEPQSWPTLLVEVGPPDLEQLARVTGIVDHGTVGWSPPVQLRTCHRPPGAPRPARTRPGTAARAAAGRCRPGCPGRGRPTPSWPAMIAAGVGA